MIKINKNISRAFDEGYASVRGHWSRFIWEEDKQIDLFGQYFGPGKAIKLINASIEGFDDPLDARVGRNQHTNSIRDMIKIQNIFAYNHMAPEIYDWILFDGHIGLIVETISHLGMSDQQIEIRKKEILEICKKYKIKPYKNDLETNYNYIGGKYVDFHGWRFDGRGIYLKDLSDRIKQITHFGRNIDGEKISYQSSDSFKGKRDTTYRLEKMKIDFKDKSVLDIGCNLGVFCIEAFKQGAAKIVGIDKSEIIQLAKEWANMCEAWGIEYRAIDINKIDQPATDENKLFDIILYLAVYQYFGLPKWVIQCLKKGGILYFEGHAHTDNMQAYSELKKHFEIQDLGFTEDRSRRILLKCVKK